MTHHLWEGVGLPLWGRAGQVPQAGGWSALLPLRWGDAEGGSGDGGGGAHGDGGGGGHGGWHLHELPLPLPGGASGGPLTAVRAHQTSRLITQTSLAKCNLLLLCL